MLTAQLGNCRVAILNRPKALNALNQPMVDSLRALYTKRAPEQNPAPNGRSAGPVASAHPPPSPSPLPARQVGCAKLRASDRAQGRARRALTGALRGG